MKKVCFLGLLSVFFVLFFVLFFLFFFVFLFVCLEDGLGVRVVALTPVHPRCVVDLLKIHRNMIRFIPFMANKNGKIGENSPGGCNWLLWNLIPKVDARPPWCSPVHLS